LVEAAVRMIEAGAKLIATNLDSSCGALVAMLESATGVKAFCSSRQFVVLVAVRAPGPESEWHWYRFPSRVHFIQARINGGSPRLRSSGHKVTMSQITEGLSVKASFYGW
jgi:hypothetical protein